MELCCRTFAELSVEELYQIAALRCAVFVVEQNCPYQDLDGLDRQAIHLFAREEDRVVGCLRILPGELPKIGRVVLDPSYRGTGLAKNLMAEAVRWIRENLSAQRIVVRAQEYAEGFYQKCGFSPTDYHFLEDGIPHVEMQYFLSAN